MLAVIKAGCSVEVYPGRKWFLPRLFIVICCINKNSDSGWSKLVLIVYDLVDEW